MMVPGQVPGQMPQGPGGGRPMNMQQLAAGRFGGQMPGAAPPPMAGAAPTGAGPGRFQAPTNMQNKMGAFFQSNPFRTAGKNIPGAIAAGRGRPGGPPPMQGGA